MKRRRAIPLAQCSRLALRAAAIFFPLAIASCAAIFLFFELVCRQAADQFIHNDGYLLESLSRAAGRDLHAAVADTFVLSRYPPLLRMLETGEARDRVATAQAFRDFAVEKDVYDPIRFLDLDGLEVVRVNRAPHREKTAFVVPDDELQDKSDRYYFVQSVSLAKEEAFVSLLDLNIEEGRIETPHKPVIRLATPVFDSRGDKRGVVVLNYLAEIMLSNIRQLSQNSFGRVFLLDLEGYWLIGRSPEEEWGFMLPGGESRTFQTAFPDAWTGMSGADGGSLRTRDGVFTYAKITPIPGLNLSWIAVSHIDNASLHSLMTPLRRISLLSGGLLGLLLLFGSCFMARAQERRQAALEESLRLREEEREERFRTLADNMSQFAWMADETGAIFWYNKRWYDYTGTTLDEMRGWGWKSVHHPDHVDRVVERVSHCFRTGEVWEDTFPLRGEDGEYRWFLSRAVPIRDERGRVLRWFGTNTDVTEERVLMEQLSRAREAAEAANRAKSEFLANMSHEIRTPMNGVLGMTELALASTGEPQVRQYLEMVRQSGQALLAIINDILDMSKVEAGKVELERKPFRLREAVSATLAPLSVMAAKKNLELFYAIDAETPEGLLGDGGRFRQILTNVVSNAVKYTRTGSVAVSVGVEQDEPERVCLHVIVRDTGVGIAPEKLPLLFEPFSQIGASAHVQYGGTGLGLYITKRLLELMDGRIWAESEEGVGSTFHFTISFGLAPEAEPSVPESPAPSADPARRLTVLLVEDNMVNRLLAGELLKKRGHKVREARDGQEALDRLRRERFDLVLMDVRMPVMDGLEATKRIRNGEAGDPDVPIIALTAHALKGDEERFLLAGMNAYLTKPVDVQALEGALASLG